MNLVVGAEFHPIDVVNLKTIKQCHSGEGLLSFKVNKLFDSFVK
jgi:hypothetical protein